MNKFSLLSLLILLSINILLAQDFSSAKLLSAKELKEDYKIFRSSITEAHPAVYRHISKSNLNSFFDSIYDSLKDSTSMEEFTRLLFLSVAKIRCVHTFANFPASFNNNPEVQKYTLLPLNFKFIEKEAYISENLFGDSTVDYLGHKVISINGVLVQHYVEQFYPLIFADGFIQTTRYEQLGEKFKFFLSIFISRPDTFSLLTENPLTNERKVIQLSSITVKEVKANYNSSRKDYLPLRFKIVDSLTAYLGMDDFLIQSLKSHKLNYKKFLSNSFEKIKKSGVKHLIIDIRNNQGGHGEVVATLFSYLTEKNFIPDLSNSIKYLNFDQPFMKYEIPPKLSSFKKESASVTDSGYYTLHRFHENLKKEWKPQKHVFKGRVSLLTSGATYSASSQFALLFKIHNRGPIIGEETGGNTFGPTGYERLFIELPNSKSIVQIPLIITRFNVKDFDFNHGVIPTHELTSSEKIKSLSDKSDPAMAKAMSLYFDSK